MLTVCSTSNFENNKSRNNFLIVRNKKFNVKGAIWFPELSPSMELYLRTLENKKTDNNWFEGYKESFIEEMNKPIFQANLLVIRDLLDKGQTVTLICYCQDYTKCHRFIIAEYFKLLGYEVKVV